MIIVFVTALQIKLYVLAECRPSTVLAALSSKLKFNKIALKVKGEGQLCPRGQKNG